MNEARGSSSTASAPAPATATAAHRYSLPSYVSNDSSLGPDDYQDAVQELDGKVRMFSLGGTSSGYGSNRSRARSSSASTLVPNPAAAELMAALASSESSKHLDISQFSTAGEFDVPGSTAADEGEPGGSLRLDGSKPYGDDGSSSGSRRFSKNPFIGDGAGNSSFNTAVGSDGSQKRRRWPPPEHQQPPRMVVVDISSAETTPNHTPVNGRASMGAAGDGTGGGAQSPLWGAHSPSLSPPPLPALPPRPAARRESNSSSTATNPFATEAAAIARSPPNTGANPFITANSAWPVPINPFDLEEEEDETDGARNSEDKVKQEEETFSSPLGGRAVVADRAAASSDGGSGSAVTTSTAAAVREQKPKPPPLPPRRMADAAHPSSTSSKVTSGEGSSCPASPGSAPSSATSQGGGGLDSCGIDGTASESSSDTKYMVVNKDTGQKFDVRELDQHLPTEDYTLLPSRKRLIELERQRSVGSSSPSSYTSALTTESKAPSPRSSISAAVAASMAAAVGKTSAPRVKAKHLGSMMRKKLGKRSTQTGTGTTISNSSSGIDGKISSGRGSGDNSEAAAAAAAKAVAEAVAEGDYGDAAEAKGLPTAGTGSGGPGDRGSVGVGGAAARAVSGALAGIRVSFKGKDSSETLAGLMLFQELQCHEGPIWAAAFNQSGQYLATAGQDARILLHRVGDIRDENPNAGGDVSGASQDSSGAKGATPSSADDTGAFDAPNEDVGDAAGAKSGTGSGSGGGGEGGGGGGGRGDARRMPATAIIDATPWQIWEAHRGDVVALSWSRNDFLLSASLDKTVRLWHITQGHCLHFFQHADIVTSVEFHPCFEHFFLSGCFDKKIRVWNIRDGRVQEWQQAPDMVTAAKFSLDGQMIVAGLFKGEVLFYQTEGMRYFTQIECRNRRGNKKRGCKVSGFAFKRTSDAGSPRSRSGSSRERDGIGKGSHAPGANASGGDHDPHSASVTPLARGRASEGIGAGTVSGGGGLGAHIPEQLLVTTNDSRLRLYNTDDFSMNAKYKGFTNDTMQITASFSEDGRQIICGSENGKVYVWSTGVFAKPSPSSLPGTPSVTPSVGQSAAPAAVGLAPSQKDTNRSHESFFATSSHPRIVTAACFVPESTSRACVAAVRGRLTKEVEDAGGYCGCMILATDYNGCVRVYCKSSVLFR